MPTDSSFIFSKSTTTSGICIEGYNNRLAKEIYIPSEYKGMKVTVIKKMVSNSISLPVEKIYIPETVEIICTDAFFGCQSLIEIVVDENNGSYSSDNGVLFDKQKGVLIYYPLGRYEDYVLPDETLAICDNSFKDSYIKSLTTNNCQTISTNAFNNVNFMKLIISEPMERLGNSSFVHCVINDLIYQSKNENTYRPFYECVISKQNFLGEDWNYPECYLINKHIENIWKEK